MKTVLTITMLLGECFLWMGQYIVVGYNSGGNTWTTSTGWSATGTTTAATSCTPGCVPVTVPSTVAGDLLIVEYYSAGNFSLSSISGGGTWGFSANCNKFQTGAGAISCGWVLSETGSVTSITPTLSGTDANAIFHFRSYHPSTSTAVAETVPAATTSAGCSNNCTTPTVTLSGTSDVVIAAIVTGDTGCSVASPFGNFSAPGGDGIGDRVNSSSGTGATFTQGTSCPTAASAAAAMSTIAFK